MIKRYVIVSANVTSSSDLVKKVNELLDKGYQLHGSPQVVSDSHTDQTTIYQAMTKD